MRYLRTLILGICVLCIFSAKATHIRAGEVVARRVSGLTYQFTFIGYRDVEGVPFGNGVFEFGDGNTFGGQNESIPWETPVDLGNGVEKWQFTITYTYSGASNYLVSYREDFRNADIQNMSGSVSTTFYVETLVVIDPLIINSTPFFTVPPIDQGVVGAVFEHNPGAFDPDGDSLSYYFTTPKQNKGLVVNGYQSLIDPGFYINYAQGNQNRDGEPTLSIDPVTGTIRWDAPGGATIPDLENREFNVAFVVEEWRRVNGELIRLGFVTRDMQIIIWNYDNEPPELEVPDDTCVVAGTTLTGTAIATDPDGDPVRIEAFGGPFEVSPTATVDPDPAPFEGPPATLDFEWTTACGLVRVTPYEVQFKASDDPSIPGVPNPPSQVNFETWRITVVGPSPEGLTVNRQANRTMQLSWSPYSCTNADSMQVWRRVGEFEFNPTCETGVPANAGYQLVETLPIESTSYLDDNNGLGLSSGSKYCYRLVAIFPDPAGGESLVSEEACDSLLVDVPVITHVDVQQTDEVNGVIEVRWTPPYQIDTVAFPPAYTYEVLRKEGASLGGGFTSVRPPSADTVFTDSNLNTEDITYSYKIVLYDNSGNAVKESQQASAVRLELRSQVGSIGLNWNANVPWSNVSQNFPYHYIYRDNVVPGNESQLQVIDSILVTSSGFNYLDDGSFNGIGLDENTEYCYYVTTSGTYDNDLLPEPLLNKSQIICGQPNDSIPPCPPINFTFSASLSCEAQVANTPCGLEDQFSNEFSWQENGESTCDDDISFFRIYFSATGAESGFTLLDETRENRYSHEGLSTLAGCYYVTAVDRSGNESPISEVICNDNCPKYVLPNVITPNGDGRNDTFRPFDDGENCYRFVESVYFQVFNRAGAVLFEYDSSEPEKTLLIDWDGTNKAGVDLPAGVYFYSADVVYDVLNPNDREIVLSGWVQIIR